MLPADMPARLRRWGLDVETVPGWEHRGRAGQFDPKVVVCHHTGTKNPRRLEFPTRTVLIDGRSDLAGPLCNFGLSPTGRVLLVAAGVTNNAGRGGWAGFAGNRHTVGIEAENDGVEPWPADQLDAYDLLAACSAETVGAGAGMVCAHFEWAPHRKDDPHNFDMPAMRSRVSHLLAHPPHAAAASHSAPQEDHDMTPEQDRRLKDIAEVVTSIHAGNFAGSPAVGPGSLKWLDEHIDAKLKPVIDTLARIEAAKR